MYMLVVSFCCGIFTGDYKNKVSDESTDKHFITNLDHRNILERMKGKFKH